MTTVPIHVEAYILKRFLVVLSVLLRFADSDYPFGIFKLFLLKYGLQSLNKDIYWLCRSPKYKMCQIDGVCMITGV